MTAYTPPDTLHRLVKHALDSGAAASIAEAEAEALSSGYRIALRVAQAQARDSHHQAALLTAVALARRVFLGGVTVTPFGDVRRTHDALDALAVAIDSRKVNWILDADIRSRHHPPALDGAAADADGCATGSHRRHNRS